MRQVTILALLAVGVIVTVGIVHLRGSAVEQSPVRGEREARASAAADRLPPRASPAKPALPEGEANRAPIVVPPGQRRDPAPQPEPPPRRLHRPEYQPDLAIVEGVVLLKGLPLDCVKILALDRVDGGRMGPRTSAVSDTEGRFRIEIDRNRLAAGEPLYLDVVGPLYALVETSHPVFPPASDVVLPVRSECERSLEVRVRNDLGDWLAGLMLKVYADDQEIPLDRCRPGLPAETDGDGRWSSDELPDGELVIKAIGIRKGEGRFVFRLWTIDTSQRSVELVLPRNREVRGRVTDPEGNPLGNARIRARAVASWSATATDGDGRFVLTVARGDEYKVDATRQDYGKDWRELYPGQDDLEFVLARTY